MKKWKIISHFGPGGLKPGLGAVVGESKAFWLVVPMDTCYSFFAGDGREGDFSLYCQCDMLDWGWSKESLIYEVTCCAQAGIWGWDHPHLVQETEEHGMLVFWFWDILLITQSAFLRLCLSSFIFLLQCFCKIVLKSGSIQILGWASPGWWVWKSRKKICKYQMTSLMDENTGGKREGILLNLVNKQRQRWVNADSNS